MGTNSPQSWVKGGYRYSSLNDFPIQIGRSEPLGLGCAEGAELGCTLVLTPLYEAWAWVGIAGLYQTLLDSFRLCPLQSPTNRTSKAALFDDLQEEKIFMRSYRCISCT
jgi:hypothetical protein